MILKDVELVQVDNEYFLLSDESVNSLWCFSINGTLVIGYFDDFLGKDIDWVKNVIALPEMIGFCVEGANDDGTFTMRYVNDDHVKKIIENDNKCKIEVETLNTENIIDFNPSLHNSFSPVLLDNTFVIIHIDEIQM